MQTHSPLVMSRPVDAHDNCFRRSGDEALCIMPEASHQAGLLDKCEGPQQTIKVCVLGKDSQGADVIRPCRTQGHALAISFLYAEDRIIHCHNAQ